MAKIARYPLYIQRYVRIVQYWGKLLNTSNCILSTLYESAVIDAENGKINWVSRLKDLLTSFGFGDDWHNQRANKPTNQFVCTFKQRVIDGFLQKWRADIESNGVMTFYKHIKTKFCFENYLLVCGKPCFEEMPN